MYSRFANPSRIALLRRVGLHALLGPDWVLDSRGRGLVAGLLAALAALVVLASLA